MGRAGQEEGQEEGQGGRRRVLSPALLRGRGKGRVSRRGTGWGDVRAAGAAALDWVCGGLTLAAMMVVVLVVICSAGQAKAVWPRRMTSLQHDMQKRFRLQQDMQQRLDAVGCAGAADAGDTGGRGVGGSGQRI